MTKIFGKMERKERPRLITLGTNDTLIVEVMVGSAKNSKKIVDIEVYEYEKGMFRVMWEGKAIKELMVDAA